MRLAAFLTLTLLAASLPGQTTLRLWPGPAGPSHEHDTTTATGDLVAGKRVARITDVSDPTITVYLATSNNNKGAAVVVFPGGGYRILAYDLEGTEVCSWLNAAGVSCVLLKYRVPDAGPYPAHAEDLADAQRAVRLTRQHAVEWKVDPKRVGVLGFSAGGHLAAVLSNQADTNVYKAANAADQLSARPDFVVLVYPWNTVNAPVLDKVGEEVRPGDKTPPTFLVQAEDDPVHVENASVYYAALRQAHVPAEMHLYANGGHGYGLRPTELPVTHWPDLALKWFYTIGALGGGGLKNR